MDGNPGPALVLVPVVLGAFFSLFESALFSARRARLRKAAEGGRGLYKKALAAAESPAFYLGTARIWGMIFRVLAGAAAGWHVSVFVRSGRFLAAAAFVPALIAAILVFGDLIPRLAALAAPEKIAAFCLPLMFPFALICRPFGVLAGLPDRLRAALDLETRGGMTEDELRSALEEGEKSGVVESRERTMVEGVFYLGDRPVGTFMTHRSEIRWLDIHADREEMIEILGNSEPQDCLPVADGTLDRVTGAVFPADLSLALLKGLPGGLAAVLRKVRFVPETMSALKALDAFKGEESGCLFVMDEYGGFAGMVSVRDLVAQIVEISGPETEEEDIVRQEDGAWLARGSVNIDEVSRVLSLESLTGDHQDYHTLAGFILSLAGEIPRSGAVFDYSGYRFTVMSMDGNRIDRVRIEALPGEP